MYTYTVWLSAVSLIYAVSARATQVSTSIPYLGSNEMVSGHQIRQDLVGFLWALRICPTVKLPHKSICVVGSEAWLANVCC